MKLKVIDKRLHGWGLPSYETGAAAGMDIRACIEDVLFLDDGERALIGAGFALDMSKMVNMAAFVYARSGLAHKQGLGLSNSVGVIDNDYRGEIKVSVLNTSGYQQKIRAGDRIAQMVFKPIFRPEFQVVESFESSTERGAGGFGSTGLN